MNKKYIIKIIIILVAISIASRILYLNKTVPNQKIYRKSLLDTIEYNNVGFKVIEISNTEFEIPKEKEVNFKTITAKIEFFNEKDEMVYIDMSSFYIYIENWFSNIDLESYYKLNPSIHNVRIALSPNARIVLYLPFNIYYESDAVFSKHINNSRSARLSVGCYPERYDIEVQNPLYKKLY